MSQGQTEQEVAANEATEVQKGPTVDFGFYSGTNGRRRNYKCFSKSHIIQLKCSEDVPGCYNENGLEEGECETKETTNEATTEIQDRDDGGQAQGVISVSAEMWSDSRCIQIM